MRKNSLAFVLVLAALILAGGTAYPGFGPPGGTSGPPAKGHPWEGDINVPSGCSPVVIQDDGGMIMMPIFSDFFIFIYIKGVHKEGEDPGSSVKVGNESYQIIFPW